jgi:type II secretory pathway pseudopilin PulG
MLRGALKNLVLLGLFAAAAVGIYTYQTHNSVQAQLRREQERTAELRQIVQRLEAERRVADVIVTDQRTIDGTLRTSILFVEYARDGTSLPPRRFTVEGKTVHLDAMVIKFDGKFVEQNDPLRGHSIALFTRLYGDTQRPADGFAVDEPGQVPGIYQTRDPQLSQFEKELWQNFWRLADDPAYRATMGVRTAQGEGVWRPFEPDRLYTITLESNGGLNIRSEPLRGIYSEALKLRSSVPTTLPD